MIFSGLIGFTLLCLPKAQPGVFRKVVKSVDLFCKVEKVMILVQALHTGWHLNVPDNSSSLCRHRGSRDHQDDACSHLDAG